MAEDWATDRRRLTILDLAQAKLRQRRRRQSATGMSNPPVLRYKSTNSRLHLTDAEETGRAIPALRRVPPRIKAVAGPILDDFLQLAVECDRIEDQLQVQEAANDELSGRLDETKSTLGVVTSRYTHANEQIMNLRRQLGERRQDEAERKKQALRIQRETGEQVMTVRKELEDLRRENKRLKASLTQKERKDSLHNTDTAVIPLPPLELRTRKDVKRDDELKRLVIQTSSLNDDLERQLEVRRELEGKLEKAKLELELKDRALKELTVKHDSTSKTVLRLQDRMAATQEFLNMEDGLRADAVLQRVVRMNEEISHLAGLIATSAPLAVNDLHWPEISDLDRMTVTSFLSRQFLPLLTTNELEKRRLYLDLAVRACLVSQVDAIVECGCFGLRDDLNEFLDQLTAIVRSETSQTTAARWRAITHQAIRHSPEFPVDHSLADTMVHILSSILSVAGCPSAQEEATKWKDNIYSIHGSAAALEVDIKQKVMSTFYHIRVPAVHALFQALEMTDVSVMVEGLRSLENESRVGLRRVLATVGLGLVATYGPARKKAGSRIKTEVRLESAVVLDDIIPQQPEND